MEDEDIKHIMNLLNFSHGKYDIKKIFYDVVMLETYFINIFIIGRKELAKDFDQTMEFYTSQEQMQIWQILMELALLYKKQQKANDILGEIYNRLQIHNGKLGQFFTPAPVSDFMAKVNGISDKQIFESGYVSFYEPCCRSGRYDISLCKRSSRKRL